ncbi:MAG: hypothetical protein HDT36_01580 [Clostridiales bacterium]|nr:hypothetical protein [Clostridiales bacterium]
MDESMPNNKCYYCIHFRRHHIVTDRGLFFTKDGNGDCKLDNKCVNKNTPPCEKFATLDGTDCDEWLTKEERRALRNFEFQVWFYRLFHKKRKK